MEGGGGGGGGGGEKHYPMPMRGLVIVNKAHAAKCLLRFWGIKNSILAHVQNFTLGNFTHELKAEIDVRMWLAKLVYGIVALRSVFLSKKKESVWRCYVT